jgi:hypothetical protein
MEQKRAGFFFYRAIFDSVSQLKKRERAIIYEAIFAYALDMEEPNMEGWSDTARAIWTLAKPMLDNDLRRFENGCKGGAPKGSHNNPRGRGVGTNRELTENKPTNNKNRIQVQEQVQEQSVCEEGAHTPTREEVYLKNQFDLFPRWCSENAPSVLDFEEPLTFEQFSKLFTQYGAPRIMQCAKEIHNKKAVGSNRNAMTTFSGWITKINLAC